MLISRWLLLALPLLTAGMTAPTALAGPKQGDRVLWNHWFTITVNKTIPYAYYNSRAETKKGRVILQNHAWKLEEGFVNEEQVGAFATDDEDLTPLFFNYHSTYRSTETTVDGNVRDENGHKMLLVRVRRSSAPGGGGAASEEPLIRRSVPRRTIFSELFPVWLRDHLSNLKPGRMGSFQAILEDSFDTGFTVADGQIRVEPPDELARAKGATRLTVSFRDLKSSWWVDPTGAPIRIEMPLQKTVVERVTEEKARAFLKPR